MSASHELQQHANVSSCCSQIKWGEKKRGGKAINLANKFLRPSQRITADDQENVSQGGHADKSSTAIIFKCPFYTIDITNVSRISVLAASSSENK